MSTFPWYFQQGEKHYFVIFNNLLIISCYSVLFGFYVFIATQNLGDEGRTRHSNNWKRAIKEALLRFPLGSFPCWLELNPGCQEGVAGCHRCSRETAALEGAQREGHLWAVPAAHRILPACEQHPCVMDFTLIFPFFSRTTSHQESLQGLTNLCLLIHITSPWNQGTLFLNFYFTSQLASSEEPRCFKCMLHWSVMTF